MSSSRPGTPCKRPAETEKRRILFLDDDPVRAQLFLNEQPEAVWVQTALDCIAKLVESWDEVHLDHDLGGEQFVDHSREDCGMEVVRWICLEPRPHLKATKFLVHSHNLQAATMMGLQLLSNGFRVDVRPFGSPPVEEPVGEQGEEPDPLVGPIKSFLQALARFFMKGPRRHGYSYEEYRRGGGPPEQAEPLDLSWVKRSEIPRGREKPPQETPGLDLSWSKPRPPEEKPGPPPNTPERTP
jgi:hypothetical protein